MAPIRTPLILFLVAVSAIGGVAAAGMAMHRAVRSSDAAATEEALDLGEVERLRGLRERVSRKARTVLLTGDQRFLRELRESERAFGDLLTMLRGEAETQEERGIVERLSAREAQRHTVTDALIAARGSGTAVESVGHSLETDLQPILDALDSTTVELVEFHRAQVALARAGSEKTFGSAAQGLWVAAAIALVIASLTSLMLARTLERIEGRAGRLQRERDRFFDLSIDMVCVAGTDGYFKQLKPAFETTLGHTRGDLLGKPFVEFVHVEDREATLKEVAKLSEGRLSIDFENRYLCKDGTYRWLSWRASPEAGGFIYATARDITELKANQQKLAALTEELRVLAIHDELTGLHNRRGFHVLAEQHLKGCQRGQKKAVFFFIDLDGLKQINDKQGHDVGDQAIREAANVLGTAFRKSDIVARLGGDEFAVLATEAGSEQIQSLTERVQETVRKANASGGERPFVLAMSIGAALYDPDQPESVDAILKRADELMYEQKVRRKAAAAPKT